MINIHIQGNDMVDVATKFMSGVSTDILMNALSSRVAAEGLNVVLEGRQVTTQAGTTADKQATRAAAAAAKKAAEAEAKAKAEAEAKARAQAQTQVEAAASQSDDDDDFGTSEETNSVVTINDVKAALDAFKAKKGLVDARRIMVEVGGSSKLIDIPAEKYGAIISALKAAE